MNLFIVRDFARTDSSEPSVQVWKKKEKKASCLKKPYGKINYYMLFIFSKGVGEGNIILALSILTGVGGPGTQNFSIGDPFFRGRMSLGQFLWNPIPHVIFHWNPDSLLHQDPSLPRVSAVSGFVCFLFFTSHSTIFQLRRDGSSCVEQVLS